MMIIAWMFISSVAIIIPKYYKTVGPQDGVCGMALWLQVSYSKHIVSLTPMGNVSKYVQKLGMGIYDKENQSCVSKKYSLNSGTHCIANYTNWK